MVKQISDNEIYLSIKYIKSVLWRVAKCLSYIEEARCLKVNNLFKSAQHVSGDKFAHPQEHFFDCIYSFWYDAPTHSQKSSPEDGRICSPKHVGLI